MAKERRIGITDPAKRANQRAPGTHVCRAEGLVEERAREDQGVLGSVEGHRGAEGRRVTIEPGRLRVAEENATEPEALSAGDDLQSLRPDRED